MVQYAQQETPLGVARIGYEDGAVVSLGFLPGDAVHDAPCPPPDVPCPLTDAAFAVLNASLCGEAASAPVPLRVKGTAFQRQVWAALAAIPRGETRTYGELAKAIGRPRAARAVGAACGANPVAVLIPCHRAVGAGGALVGYAWGLERKAMLLRLEAGG